MTSLGLAAFVAMTGLHAGPVFVPALKDAGLGLLLGGIVVTMVPLFVGLAFGHWVLRMNPVLLLGGLAGALTMTAAMAAVQTRADSPVAVLGYTPAYPVGADPAHGLGQPHRHPDGLGRHPENPDHHDARLKGTHGRDRLWS